MSLADQRAAKRNRIYTQEDVEAHSSATDCWVTYKGKVYDVSSIIHSMCIQHASVQSRWFWNTSRLQFHLLCFLGYSILRRSSRGRWTHHSVRRKGCRTSDGRPHRTQSFGFCLLSPERVSNRSNRFGRSDHESRVRVWGRVGTDRYRWEEWLVEESVLGFGSSFDYASLEFGVFEKFLPSTSSPT